MPAAQRYLDERTAGMAESQVNFSNDDLLSVPVRLPPMAEQQRIAEILDVVDESIRSTELAIVKLEKTSRALLADQLIVGDGWRRMNLRDLLVRAPRNGYSPSEAEAPTGTFMLGLGCLTPNGFVPRQLKNAPAGDPALKRALLRDGDLLMSRANTRDLVGLVGRFRSFGHPCIYPDLMMRLTPNKEVRPAFLELLLRSPSSRRQIRSRAVGTSESMVKISAAILLHLEVAVPALEDQDRILARLDAFNEALARLAHERDKRRQMKRGLMEDLLTGRVRVP